MQQTEVNKDGMALVRSLIDSNYHVDVIVPTNIPLDKLRKQIDLCCQVGSYLENSRNKLLIIVGRLLNVARDNPDTFKELGYQTFTAYKEHVAKCSGWEHSSIHAGMRIAATWPMLTPTQYSNIGRTKLYLLSEFVNEHDKEKSNELLSLAESLTEEELREELQRRNLMHKDDSTPAMLVIRTNKGVKEFITKFVKSPDTQARCNSQDVGTILECMVAECMTTWGIQLDYGPVYDIEPSKTDNSA